MKLKITARRVELLAAIDAGQITVQPDSTITREWTDRRGVHHPRTAITSDAAPLFKHGLAQRFPGARYAVLTDLGRSALADREAP